MNCGITDDDADRYMGHSGTGHMYILTSVLFNILSVKLIKQKTKLPENACLF